jgi:hypothetical protein
MEQISQGDQHRQERERLLELLTALNASEPQLRRDECGAWCIAGRWGHINVMSESFHLVCFTDECDLDPTGHRSARRWSFAKQRLSFCAVTQDGDDEGVLQLDFATVLTAEQVEEVRDVLGIRKRRELSEEDRARLAARLEALRKQIPPG